MSMPLPTVIDRSKLRVAVIGGGACGLVAARVLDRSGISVTVFERDGHCGGIWKYNKHGAYGSRPMYRGLRTNLPVTVMAYREYPWPETEDSTSSFATHGQVQQYLNDYARRFDLHRLFKYNCSVQRFTIKHAEMFSLASSAEIMPKIELGWTESADNSALQTETFDSVLICNGHYAKPSIPEIPGLEEFFHGRTMHSIEYDDPSIFAGNVVCIIGAGPSGSDLSREISLAGAKNIYLSDSNCPPYFDNQPPTYGNITWVPSTVRLGPDSTVHFQKGPSCSTVVSHVDRIIFCTGYEYDFPFLTQNENNIITCVPGEQRVFPLYKQLWHARYPNIAFLGLPLTILPFPLFELQAEAIVSQLLCTGVPLPPYKERLRMAEADTLSGGHKEISKRSKDTHYLGDNQWDYCRAMAQISGMYDEEMNKYLKMNQAIYEYSRMRNGGKVFPFGPFGPDSYRSVKYFRNDHDQIFTAIRKSLDDDDLELTTTFVSVK